MTASVRILTTASIDSSPSLLLVAPDGSKILVDCGEGCQRSFLEHSQKLSTVKTVCLTDLRHTTIGGLPGMILTSSDSASAAAMEAAKAAANKSKHGNNGESMSGKPIPMELSGLDIIGPVGLKSLIHSLRHFMRREKFQLRVHEGVTTLRSAAKPTKRSKKSGEVDPMQLGFTVQSFQVNDNPKKRPLEGNAWQHDPLSYLFTTPPVPGKFLPDQAAALGVPKGPLFGQLKAGKTITFHNSAGEEVTVESHQVVTTPSPGMAVLVLRDYNPSVDTAAFFRNLNESLQSAKAELNVVVHLVEEGIRYTKSKSAWDRHYEQKVQHIFVPLKPEFQFDLDGTPFRSAAAGAVARSFLCPEIYRVPLPSQTGNGEKEDDITLGRSMMEFTLLPRSRQGFTQRSLPPSTDAEQETKQEAYDSGAVQESQRILSLDCLPVISTEESFDGELCFTGTGSALPCKHRNVTGMCLTVKNGNSILLDIGEGTVGQLLRTQQVESEQAVKSFLAKIRAVWISHPHADHHLGILRLLSERKADTPLFLLAPVSLFRFLQEYERVDASIRGKYIPIDCKDLVHDNPEALALLRDALGITGCRAVPVTHCPHSYAVILDGTCFGRLVYSGDCRPSHQLAQAGRGADVLIHEATFEDGMEAEATVKRHSTVGEALQVAHEMQAKCTVLTHFSQRYAKIPKPPARLMAGSTMPIVFAFDHMRLTPSYLTVAAKLTPALRLLYPEEEEQDKQVDPNESDTAVAANAMEVPGLFAQSGIM